MRDEDKDKRAKARQADKERQIDEAVIESYLANGEPMSVAEIAKACGRSESWVRGVFNRCHGTTDALRAFEGHRENRDRGYGYQRGYHKVWLYKPSMATMRRMVNELRAAASQQDTYDKVLGVLRETHAEADRYYEMGLACAIAVVERAQKKESSK